MADPMITPLTGRKQGYQRPASYLPHRAPMLLLDTVLLVDDSTVQCAVTVDEESVLAPFLDAAGNLPGWFALELMAQAVGVWSGWHQQQANATPSMLGMLLGARSVSTVRPFFAVGSELVITMVLLMRDEKIGSFDGEITCGGNMAASGRLTIYQPDPAEFIQLFSQDNEA